MESPMTFKSSKTKIMNRHSHSNGEQIAKLYEQGKYKDTFILWLQNWTAKTLEKTNICFPTNRIQREIAIQFPYDIAEIDHRNRRHD